MNKQKKMYKNNKNESFDFEALYLYSELKAGVHSVCRKEPARHWCEGRHSYVPIFLTKKYWIKFYFYTLTFKKKIMNSKCPNNFNRHSNCFLVESVASKWLFSGDLVALPWAGMVTSMQIPTRAENTQYYLCENTSIQAQNVYLHNI